jgi:predicted DNA-binding transcriptional regulator AlpA
MLSIIKALLQQYIDNIDANNTNLDYEQQCKLLKILSNVDIGQENEMNKTEAAEYLDMSRATFDNYIHDGFLPKGREVGRFKELRWYKSDLDLYLINKEHMSK